MAYFDVDDPVRAQLQEAYELTGKGPTVTLDSVTGETTLGSKRNPTAADWQRSYHKYVGNGGHLISAPKGMSNTRFYQHSLFQGKGLSYYSQPPVSQGLLADIQGTLEGTKAITEEETKESTDPNALVYRKRPPNEEQFGNEGTETVFNQGSSLDWMNWTDLVALEKSRRTSYKNMKESTVWSLAKNASLLAKGIDWIIKSNSEQATRIMNERATLSGTNMQNPSWRGYRPEDFSDFTRTIDPLNTQFSALRGQQTSFTPSASTYRDMQEEAFGRGLDFSQKYALNDVVIHPPTQGPFPDLSAEDLADIDAAIEANKQEPVDMALSDYDETGGGDGGGGGGFYNSGDDQGMGDQSPDSSGQGGYGWT